MGVPSHGMSSACKTANGERIMNLAIVTGNLGSDMEIRETAGGKQIGKLRLAINTGKDRTVWADVSFWDRLIERGRELRKGQRIVVTGRFDLREWTSKTGEVKTAFEINADNF